MTNPGAENRRRPPRRPVLTSGELAKLIEYKARMERLRLYHFRRTLRYRLQNIFNVSCFFLYVEVIVCMFGPADFRRHYSQSIVVRYGDLENGKAVVSDIDLICVDGKTYNFIINESITPPFRRTTFLIGKDFLLRKELKGRLESVAGEFRLFAASPVMFLCIMLTVVSLVAFQYNLNEHPYSLMALTVLNCLTMLGILCL